MFPSSSSISGSAFVALDAEQWMGCNHRFQHHAGIKSLTTASQIQLGIITLLECLIFVAGAVQGLRNALTVLALNSGSWEHYLERTV